MGRIDRISYQKTFNIGSYQSERIGVEIEINEGEDAKEALSTAKALVHEFYMEGIPQQVETHSVVADNAVVPIVEVKKVPNELQDAIDGINNSPDLLDLKTWWLKSKGNLILSEAYKAKEKQLKDAK